MGLSNISGSAKFFHKNNSNRTFFFPDSDVLFENVEPRKKINVNRLKNNIKSAEKHYKTQQVTNVGTSDNDLDTVQSLVQKIDDSTASIFDKNLSSVAGGQGKS